MRGQVKEARVAEDGTNRSFIITKDNGHETIRNARHMKFQALAAARKVHFSESEDEAPVADTSVGHEAPAVAEPAVESADIKKAESSGPV